MKALHDKNLYAAVFRAVSDGEPDAGLLVDEAVSRGFVRPAMRNAVLAGRLEIGMTKQEVVCVRYTPLKVNRVIREDRHQEQWVYLADPQLTAWDRRTGNPDILERLLYVDGGKLVAIHE